ncbi:hypothetical protein G6011_04353 [Alternaria panax]|uniref:NmrA-like domain-containing protein n=1 Tax=Alternaria panax TaxID=48097 RepID=A0AAD4NTX9_9PLEO|nr:hypothetical protein G6011_04353 [Alternaria panax]
MSKPTIAIFGASGNQGNSVARTILITPFLSAAYSVRALSRSISSPKMLELKSLGAELAQADMDDPSTLPTALSGCTFIFLVTTTQYTGSTREVETRQAKAVCEEALKQGVKYIIFSSMSHPFKISGGKLTKVEHFDDKAEIETYIRTLPVQSAFFAPASFMQNLEGRMRPRPSPANDGTFVLADMLPGNTPVPYIDIADTGKWVGAILAEPDRYVGKFFAAAADFYTPDEVANVMSKVTGKTVTHVQLPDEVARGFFPETFREQLYEMWVLNREYGYYGQEQQAAVQWAKEQAVGEITGLEGFLRKVEFKLV